MTRRPLAWAALLLVVSLPAGAAAGGPSRKPVKGCAWRKISDAALGLEAWVQRCDFGFRKIDFQVAKTALLIRWSDGGGTTERVVEVLDLVKGETPEAGIRRILALPTDNKGPARCAPRPHTPRTAPARAH